MTPLCVSSIFFRPVCRFFLTSTTIPVRIAYVDNLKGKRMDAIEAARKLEEIALLRRDEAFGKILVAILEGIDSIETKLDRLSEKEE